MDLPEHCEEEMAVPEMENARTAHPTPTIKADEEAGTTREQCCQAKHSQNVQLGALVVLFGFMPMLGWLLLPKEAKRRNSVQFTVSVLLVFATFLAGISFMLLSITMLGLPEHLVSGGQRLASKCLFFLCSVLSALTLLSLLAVGHAGQAYLFAGLAVAVVGLVFLVAVLYYLRRHTTGGGDMAAAAAAYDELKKKFEAASKITSAITGSASGGLFGLLTLVIKLPGPEACSAAASRVVYVAIFFMFCAAILGLFVMIQSAKVLEINEPQLRVLAIRAIRLANGLLLCLLAIGVLGSSYVVVGYRVSAAFSPLALAVVIYFAVRHWASGRGRGDRGGQENAEAWVKAVDDLASKVMTVTAGGIGSILGWHIGTESSDTKGAVDVVMILLTSAFVSSFGFMLLAVVQGTDTARYGPAATMLLWSGVGLLMAIVVGVYCIDVMH